ncbi:hypothetical protein CMO90_04250 [Candidatus Woesearchaeota archaeon]|jgi:hypothetical protein|nr:hypothetical protein [Candidatus Woesearchaeota archaeon]|tara:strand:- start:447 stop:989 length:543 start_codon:yes stop_codon:yes gene_type:complete
MKKNFLIFVTIVSMFLAGGIVGANTSLFQNKDIPTSYVVKEKASEIANSINFFAESSVEKPSPGDWLNTRQIEVWSDRVILDIQNAEWASFSNTNSMDPVIDEYANAIEVIPEKESDIQIGDIVVYDSEYSNDLIIHRIIYQGRDEQGIYYILKGDNNPKSDPGRIRFSQIKRVLVAIIY